MIVRSRTPICLRTRDDIYSVRQLGVTRQVVEPRQFPPDPGSVYSWNQKRNDSDPLFIGLTGTSRLVEESQRFPPDPGTAIHFASRITPSFTSPIVRTLVATNVTFDPGSTIVCRAPYGISPLPVRPIMSRSEPAPMHPGAALTVHPLAVAPRSPRHPITVRSEPPYPFSGTVHAVSSKLEVSHPGPTTIAASEPLPLESGCVIATHPPAVDHRTARIGNVARAGEIASDGQVISSTARSTSQTIPVMPIVSQVEQFGSSTAFPLVSHGEPARVVPVGTSRVVESNYQLAAGAVVIRTAPTGANPLPRLGTTVRTEDGPTETGSAYKFDRAVEIPGSDRRSRVVSQVEQFGSSTVFPLVSHGEPARAAPRGTSRVVESPFQFEQGSVLARSAPTGASPLPRPGTTVRTEDGPTGTGSATHTHAFGIESVPPRSIMVAARDEPWYFPPSVMLGVPPAVMGLPPPPPPPPIIGMVVTLPGYDRSSRTYSSLDCEDCC